MEIKDLNYYEIHKIQDENLKKQCINKYYFYVVNIHGVISEELKNRGLNFNYSKNMHSLTLGEMMNELKQFCIKNGISKEEMKNIIFKNTRKSKK